MSDKYRNYPTVIITFNLVLLLTFGSVALIITSKFEGSLGTSISIAIFVAMELMLILYWRLKTIIFEDDQVVVESNLLYKIKKTIPYSKIASVNVVRTIFDHIFGTTTLQININSAKNAAKPEASFVFKKDLADKLRADLMSGMFEQDFDAHRDEEYDAILKFKSTDSVLYGLIGRPMIYQANTVIWLVIMFISFMFSSLEGVVSSLILMIISNVTQAVKIIMKYHDFKIYRIDNNIRIQHGMIKTYRTSFDVAKINAIRVRRPLFARLLHKCCIEAEVVGINAVAGEVTPMICLLIKDNLLDAVMRKFLPEFIRDIPMEHEPKSAKFPLISKTTYASIAWLLLMACLLWWFYSGMAYDTIDAPAYVIKAVEIALLVVAVTIVIALYCSAYVSFKRHEFGLGNDMFRMVNGILDRETVTIQYDRVQITRVFDTPMPRRFGLSRMDVSLLSSAGARKIRSGYFDKKKLSKISEIMLERLADEEYDYTQTMV